MAFTGTQAIQQDAQVGASDQGVALSTLGKKNTAASAQELGVALSGSKVAGDILTPGSTQANVTLGAGATVTTNQSIDPGLLTFSESAINRILEASNAQQDITRRVADSALVNVQSVSDGTARALENAQASALTKDTGGFDMANKTVLYIGLGVLALAGALLWFMRKKS